MLVSTTRRGPNHKSRYLVSLLSIVLLPLSIQTASAREMLDNDNVAGDEFSDPRLRPEIVPAPEHTLPQKPEDVKENTTIDIDKAALKGSANANEPAVNLSSQAELLAANPLSRYRGDSLVFYKVSIKNGGATPVLILGRDAQFVTPSATVKTLRAATLEKHDNTLLTPKEKALVAAVGIGSAGLASSIFYEHMTPSENRNRSLGIALGRDRGRHEVESENLGTRLIMPGDETLGWVAFEDNADIRSQTTLKVPVMFPPYSSVSATLAVPITQPAQSPPPPDIQNKVR